ncbi:hypothetical protein RB200_33775 [Streptomyces sp. PmtG]
MRAEEVSGSTQAHRRGAPLGAGRDDVERALEGVQVGGDPGGERVPRLGGRDAAAGAREEGAPREAFEGFEVP